jgi:hypothetical protein
LDCPGVLNLREKVCFSPENPESNCLTKLGSLKFKPDVTVWVSTSLFIHVIVSPTLILTGLGEKALSAIIAAACIIDTFIPGGIVAVFTKAFVMLLIIWGLSIFALGAYVTMKGSLLNVIKPSAFPEKGIEPGGIKEFL